VGSLTGPYTIVASVNDTLKIQINYYDPIVITLTAGLKSATNIMNDMNGQFASASYPAVVTLNLGKLQINATLMDGIEREGIGQYKVTYVVPGTFITEGVLNNIYKDVWFYAPTVSYMQSVITDTTCCESVFVPDNTCCFIVYPEDYFTDCGYADYSYSFNLANKQLNKGEIRDFVINVEALPKYNTPDNNLWILPITNSEYMISSYGGNLITDWTPIDVNRGLDLKTRIDSTNMQDGAYKMRIKMYLPQGEIIISDWMRFNVLGPCTI
jgi:hypothetical protein